MKKVLKIIIGSLLIAISYNVFFLLYDLVPSGTFGIATLVSYKNNFDPALFLAISNLMLIVVALFTVGPEESKVYVLPGLLVPIFIFLANLLNINIMFDELEKIMVVIAGSFITGLGYSLIYKSGASVGGIDLIQDVFDSVTIKKTNVFSYIIEGIILFFTLIIFGLETMLYSFLVIGIIRYTGTKSKIGVSSSKTFYIITTKRAEVKKYIMEELNHDLTEFNTRGGFSNNKSKIIMTSMDTKNYYELKEGVLLIDPNAFISITDGYEVINKNRSLNRKLKDITNE